MKNKRITSRGLLFIKNKHGKECLALIHRLKPNKTNSKIIDDYFVIPGGGIENDEQLEETVIRELKEELGINVEVIQLLYVQEDEFNIHNYFLCKYVSGIFGTGTGPEFTDSEYKKNGNLYIPTLIPLDELDNINLLPIEFKNALQNDLTSLKFKIDNINREITNEKK